MSMGKHWMSVVIVAVVFYLIGSKFPNLGSSAIAKAKGLAGQ